MREQTEIKDGDQTPWGQADIVTKLGEGIFFASTPSHGGIYLDPDVNAKIPPIFRRNSGWYEEDCEASIPPYILGPEAFPLSGHGRQFAGSPECEREIKEWFPYAWENHTGKTLQPGESHTKDRDMFLAAHKQDLLVISASSQSAAYPSVPDGMVRVWATVGGSRCPHAVVRCFYVPKEEYAKRTPLTWFIVDPSKYQEVGV